MEIIKKENIYPIIIPTYFYMDRFGCPNSFVEMNPSIYISENKSYIILVRTVNYLKYKDKSFQIYGDSSRSLYYIIRGEIEDDKINLDNYKVESLNVEYNIPTVSSLWYGVEDIRFIDEKTVLACIPECNNSSPCIFKGVLEGSTLTNFEKCSPSEVEKNWMPYNDIDSKVIYSVSPFVIKSIEKDDREEIKLSEEKLNELRGWHGSSNGIDLFDGKLFLIHSNSDRVYSRWLLFNPKSKEVYFSKKFTFFRDSYFEFTCSLAKYDNKIVVSIGVNDNRAYIIEIVQEEILKLFS